MTKTRTQRRFAYPTRKSMRVSLICVALTLLTSCAATGADLRELQSSAGFQGSSPQSGTYAQGMIGVTTLHVDDIDIDSSLGDFSDADAMQLPLIGGAFQFPLRNDRVSFGFEGGLTLGWQGDVVAVSSTGGGLVVAADSDVRVLDFFFGPYMDMKLGARARLYAGVGPSLQFAHVDLDWDDPSVGNIHRASDGFGYGLYARAGIEWLIQSGMWVGVGARAVDASIDLDHDLSNLDYHAEQYFVTVTRSM